MAECDKCEERWAKKKKILLTNGILFIILIKQIFVRLRTFYKIIFGKTLSDWVVDRLQFFT